ncbi:MAG: hypothetical protein LUQ07_08330 [Methanospirillum sp.]|nr:hypothetical protein [Methanospirillum sp.]
MILQKISIRLGMNQGLYIGICIGILITGLVILAGYYLLSLRIIHLIAASVALVIASILVIALIVVVQNRSFTRKDEACTCRYRRSLHTNCRQCALNPGNNNQNSDRGSHEEEN